MLPSRAHMRSSFFAARTRTLPVAILASLVSLASLAPRVASAQTYPSIDARTWRPSTDPGGGVVLEPTTTPAAWNWNVGALFN